MERDKTLYEPEPDQEVDARITKLTTMVDKLQQQHLSVVGFFFGQLKQTLNEDLIADEVSIVSDVQTNEVSVII